MSRDYTTTLLTETLSAPGNGTAITDMDEYDEFVGQMVVALIDTNVVMRIEVSNDGTNYCNRDENGVDLTITTNGTYDFVFKNKGHYSCRFVFVSESGGTAATVACNMRGRHKGA